MAHVIDLKKKKEPVAQTAEAINMEVTPTLASADYAHVDLPVVIPYPALNKDEIITERGERFPYRTVRWNGPLAFRNEGTGIPYFLAILLIGVGVLVAVYQNSYIAGVMFIGMGIMTAVHAWHPHPHVPIEISPAGVKLGNRKYSHSEIVSFWLHYDLPHGVPELSLHINRWHMPYIKIPLYNQDAGQIRMILLEFVPEEEHDDPKVHRFLKHLGV